MIYPSVYVMIGLGGRSAAKPFLQMAARFSAFFFGGEKVFRIFPTAGSLTGRFVRHFTFCLHFFFPKFKVCSRDAHSDAARVGHQKRKNLFCAPCVCVKSNRKTSDATRPRIPPLSVRLSRDRLLSMNIGCAPLQSPKKDYFG